MSTSIQWTNETWNPISGCSKVSAGCKFCYAERIWPRVYGKFRPFTQVVCHEDRLEAPFKWKKPRMIFVNSMSDMFHEDVPFEFIQKIWNVMVRCPQHTFQILTKRSGRMREFLPQWTDYPAKNIWLGVSVEGPSQFGRIADLQAVPAAVHFLSLEPLLNAVVPVPLHHIDWVIVGGESGHVSKARAFDLRWAYDIVEQCRQAKVPVFVKQLGRNPVFSGGAGKAAITNLCLNDSHGGDMDEWPEDLRVREFPNV